jgi:hypothetical protein
LSSVVLIDAGYSLGVGAASTLSVLKSLLRIYNGDFSSGGGIPGFQALSQSLAFMWSLNMYDLVPLTRIVAVTKVTKVTNPYQKGEVTGKGNH